MLKKIECESLSFSLANGNSSKRICAWQRPQTSPLPKTKMQNSKTPRKTIRARVPVETPPCKMNPSVSLHDLPKETAKVYLDKYIAFKKATDTKRAEVLMDLLMYAYETMGPNMTFSILQKETIGNPLQQIVMMTAVKHHVEKKAKV